MHKYLLLLLASLILSLQADDIIKLKDESGLSEKELQEKVNALEISKTKVSPIQKIFTQTRQKPWESLRPTPKEYDWLELKSDEWLKGSFNSMYGKEVEFDSKEFDIVTFDFDDVKQIRTHKTVLVNIQTDNNEVNRGYFSLKNHSIEISGILRINENNITIIQGENVFYFQRSEVISIVFRGKEEIEKWSGKVNFSYDIRSGNSVQYDYSAISYLMRRTSATRLRFDYIGNISSTDGIENTNNHRVTEIYDIFLSQKFYITALTLQYYNDTYQNIRHQWTIGAALGYTLYDTKTLEWDVSIGPAALSTVYNTVEEDANQRHQSLAFIVRTLLDYELTKKMDLKIDFQLTKMDSESGLYKHHLVTTSENEITKWLDFDVAIVWDYLREPTAEEDGSVPKNSDIQLLIGLGIDF